MGVRVAPGFSARVSGPEFQPVSVLMMLAWPLTRAFSSRLHTVPVGPEKGLFTGAPGQLVLLDCGGSGRGAPPLSTPRVLLRECGPSFSVVVS